MHCAVPFTIALVVSACTSKDSAAKPQPDAGMLRADAGTMHADAAAQPAAASRSAALERATLPRPAADGHLPAELRPPR